MEKRKNNRTCRALLTLMSAALLLPAFSAAAAAEDAQMNLESANPSGDVLQLVFYSDAKDAPSLETLKVTIDGKPVAVESVNTIDYADPGTSYLFLFDTNTAVTERALPDMQKIAKGIVEKFGAMDQALVVPVGGEIDKKAFSDDKDKISASIDALTRGSEATDLYTSISNAVKLLENDASLRPRRCLIVMADGLDNTPDGISSLEVSTQVSQSHVPVYVVALTYNTKTEERIEAAKEISGIARLSPGGVSILLKNDGVSTQGAVDAIFAQRAHTFLAALKAEAVRAATTADKAEITITQTVEGAELSTERKVSLAGLSGAAAAETDAAANTPATEATPMPAAAQDDGTDIAGGPNTLLYAAIVAAAAAIAAAVVVLTTRKNRRKNEEGGAAVRFAPAPEPKKVQQAEKPMICIVKLGEKEEILVEGALTEEILLGEGETTPILPKSTKEGIKTRLIWRDGTVWAMQNSEGVLVNGQQARANACLNVGDVLQVCGVDYRIFYSAN